MGIGEHVGKIGTYSECNKQKVIGLEWERGIGAKGNVHSPYLKCDDCMFLDLGKR